MTWVLIVAALGGALFGSAFFSGSETGLYCTNRLRLHLGVQQGDARAVRLSKWLEDEQRSLAVTLAGTNVMNYLCTVLVAYAFTELLGQDAVDTEVYTVLLVTPVVFVFGEVVPKNLFQRHADLLMLRASRLLVVATRVFQAMGLVALLTALTRGANRLFGATNAYRASPPKRRIASLLQEALVGQVHGEHQSGLIDRVIGLSETPVRRVMIPNARVVSLSTTASRRELMRIGRVTAYARLPVYLERRSQVVGIVKVEELLRQDGWTTVGEKMNPIIKLSSTTTAGGAIAQMRRGGSETAAVVDAAGNMVGIVTLRDLLEEVVGELGAVT